MTITAIAVIPARFHSTRFPGKMLHPILGKSLIQHTYEQALKCPILERVVIAVDHPEVADHVRSFGAEAIMTDPSCPSGSDRILQALEVAPHLDTAQVVVNIQGDEPCFPVEAITRMVEVLCKDKEAVMSTAITPIDDPQEIHDPSVVKCVTDRQGRALYFSRSPIPGAKTGSATGPFFKHLGLYAFRRPFLSQYARLPPTPLQVMEDLEQLKVLEHGERIATILVDEDSIGVNTPEDILKVKNYLWNQNTSSLQVELSPL